MENLQTNNISKENEIFKVKCVAKKDMIFRLLKIVPFLLIALLFTIPFININMFIDEIKISMFDLIFSTKDSETIKGFFASGLMSDYFGLGQNYENFIQGMYAYFSKRFDNISSINSDFSVRQILQFIMASGYFFILNSSAIVFVVITILSLIFGIKSIFDGNVEASLRGINNQTFEEIFYPEHSRQIEKNENYYEVEAKVRSLFSKSMIKITIHTVIGWIIILFTYLFLPVKIIIFLMNTSLVTVDTTFIVLCVICILTACVFTVVEYRYWLKNASTLDKGKRVKKIIKYARKSKS